MIRHGDAVWIPSKRQSDEPVRDSPTITARQAHRIDRAIRRAERRDAARRRFTRQAPA